MTPDQEMFPYNVIHTLVPFLETIDGVDQVVERQMQETDQTGFVGITAVDWRPLEYNIGTLQPVIAEYLISIWTMVKHAGRAEGEREHTLLSKRVRNLLLRDPDVRVALFSLREGSSPPMERVIKPQIVAQRFAQTEMSSTFVFVSGLDLSVTTEIAG